MQSRRKKRLKGAMTLYQAEAYGTGMTLVEMLVAMAIMVIVLAAIVPQIRAIRSSWDSKAKNVEAIQNGRVLVDHITSKLSQATQIATISDSNETNGYIEFLNNDGNTMRYEIDAGNYVVYGPVGSLSELAGPVSQLRFTCYDACDLDTPITDVNLIRNIKVQTTMTNSAAMGRNQMFRGQAYLRTNATSAGGDIPTISESPASECEFESQRGHEPALCQIDATHYLCAYSGFGSDGFAVVLAVDTNSWTITSGTKFEFDTSSCQNPKLARIDATNYLCAYEGFGDDGWSVILTVNTGDWTITKGTPFEFDTDNLEYCALTQIDSDDFLCAYSGPGPGAQHYAMAVILTVDTGSRTIIKGTPLTFSTSNTFHLDTVSIDDVHHLCICRHAASSKAYVLTADPVTKTVTLESELIASATFREPAMCKIDQNHYLAVCLERIARILTVDTFTWVISEGTCYDFGEENSFYSDVAWISDDYYLWAYGGQSQEGLVRALEVDIETDTITSGVEFAHEEGGRGYTPELAKVDDTHFLIAYEKSAGEATILKLGSGPILP